MMPQKVETMKINKNQSPKRTKPTQTDWHSLTTDELVLWAYMWLGCTNNSRFSESQRTMALRLHVIRETLKDRLKKLVAKSVIYLDKKKAPAKDGWNFQDSYTVTNPPACVLRMAHAVWAVGVERGQPAPYGWKPVHGETRVNIDDTRGLDSTHLTTLCNQCKQLSESPSVISYGTLTVDSVGGRIPPTPLDFKNRGDARGLDSTHAAKVPVDDLQATEAELSRVKAEMRSYTTSEPPEELFARRRALVETIKRLKAVNAATMPTLTGKDGSVECN
jgi:hypothetical protein